MGRNPLPPRIQEYCVRSPAGFVETPDSLEESPQTPDFSLPIPHMTGNALPETAASATPPAMKKPKTNSKDACSRLNKGQRRQLFNLGQETEDLPPGATLS